MSKQSTKTLRVVIKPEVMPAVKPEFDAWRVDPATYEIEGNVVTTRNLNVVDVITETLFSDTYQIEVA